MSREASQLRGHIAHLAARLMVRDGVSDYGMAKRKAAREAGAPDTRHLPSNEEVEDALRAYQDLFHPQEHARRLRELREDARELMRLLEPFHPYLTGALVGGSIGTQAEICLHLYTDRGKDLELFLANQGLAWGRRDQRLLAGGAEIDAPGFFLDTPGAPMSVLLLDPRLLRQTLRTASGGPPLERLSLTTLESVLCDGGTSA